MHLQYTPDDLTRFWSLVQKTDTCWFWDGHCDKRSGYGIFRFNHYPYRAHRVSWDIAFGDVPGNLFVCHHCDVKNCVRPDHLFIGTTSDNMADMVRKGRQAKGERAGVNLYPERYPRGEDSPKAKLRACDVLDIRRLIKVGADNITISHLFGVHRATIYGIKSGANWAHLKDEG